MNPKALPCGSNQNATKNTQNTTVPNSRGENDRILVFVSASMPLASLQNLLRDAQGYEATLVMRGLQGNSFKETAAFIQKLTQGLTSTQGIDIDPELFMRFNVTHVPVFIRLKEGQELARLSGNVSLAFASSKLREGV
jgi:conjugal transfer pilus assembly protein TrbC